jgi:hypothetical protein
MATADNPDFLSIDEIDDFFSDDRSLRRFRERSEATRQIDKDERAGLDVSMFLQKHLLNKYVPISSQVEQILKETRPNGLSSFKAHPYSKRFYIGTNPDNPQVKVTFYDECVSISDLHKTENGVYFFTAHLDDSLTLAIDAYLKLYGPRQELVRSKFLPNYSFLLPFAVRYFEGLGFPVLGVRGTWSTFGLNTESSNLKIYREQYSLGATPEQAALLTPSGKVAAKAGFTKVERSFGRGRPLNGKRGAGFIFYKISAI